MRNDRRQHSCHGFTATEITSTEINPRCLRPCTQCALCVVFHSRVVGWVVCRQAQIIVQLLLHTFVFMGILPWVLIVFQNPTRAQRRIYWMNVIYFLEMFSTVTFPRFQGDCGSPAPPRLDAGCLVWALLAISSIALYNGHT